MQSATSAEKTMQARGCRATRMTATDCNVIPLLASTVTSYKNTPDVSDIKAILAYTADYSIRTINFAYKPPIGEVYEWYYLHR
jgi:hypothetical protein